MSEKVAKAEEKVAKARITANAASKALDDAQRSLHLALAEASSAVRAAAQQVA